MSAQAPGHPRLPPPVILLISAVLMVVLHYTLPFAAWPEWLIRAWGIIPIAFAVLVGLLGGRQFIQRHTTIIPFETSSALIEEGPFRYTRNPLYLSMTLILIGIWILLGSFLGNLNGG